MTSEVWGSLLSSSMCSTFPKWVRVTSKTARVIWRAVCPASESFPKQVFLVASEWGRLWDCFVIGFLQHVSGQDKCWTSGVMWIMKDWMSCHWHYYSLRWVSLLDWVNWQGFNSYEEVSGGKPSPADKIEWLWKSSRNKMEIFTWSRSCLHQMCRACHVPCPREMGLTRKALEVPVGAKLFVWTLKWWSRKDERMS